MSKPIILIVEDNYDNMSLLKILLERENFQVLTAQNGQMGLDIVQKETPNLVVLDLDMPVMDGWEMLEKLKAETSTQDIPIVVVTAHLLSGEYTKVLRAGADGYVSKPFRVSTLITEIKKYL